MKKKITATIMGMAMMAAMFTGCSGSAAGDTITSVAESVTTTADVTTTESSMQTEAIAETTTAKEEYESDEFICEGYYMDETYGYCFDYDEYEHHIEIVGIYFSGDVVIPSEINGKSVTVLGPGRYGNGSSIASYDVTSVVIPESVTHISDNAFHNSGRLQGVLIEGDIEYIGMEAFSYCENLTVFIANNMSSVPLWCFRNCKYLETVVIANENSSISKISQQAFEGCYRLKTFMTDGGIDEIDPTAFEKCSELTNIVMTEEMTEKYTEYFVDTPWYRNRENQKTETDVE